MKKGLVPGLTFVAALALAAAPAFAEEHRDMRSDGGNGEAAVAQPDSNVVAAEETPSHIFLTREENEKATARQPLARRSPNMTYHGGVIMKTATVKDIFWGTSWLSSDSKIAGLQSFYQGFNQSHYAITSDEYTGSNGQVGPTISVLSPVVDNSKASGGGSTSAILSEACKWFTGPNDGTAYYAVYTDLPRGHAGYCAWHSSGTCGGTAVRFAFFWKLDGDAGCDPQDTTTGHPQGLAALANVSAHELSEARTDPGSPGAWYDSSGQENGDKCAWAFNVPSVQFSDGSYWKVQGEWSNAAYTAGTGYPNLSGQKGCLDGH
ncbi:MAG: hypothetical protein ACHQJD_00535 [Thermoanaerobaculia bacterium]